MTIQLVALTCLNPDAENALDEYLRVVGPLMHVAGARLISRFELLDTIAGNNTVQYVSVVEYPDEASIKSVFESDEYKSLESIKRQAFSTYQVSTAITL